MKLVIDVSVAVKGAVMDEGREQAVALLKQDHEFFAPDFLLLELGSVLWKKARMGEITSEHAQLALAPIQSSFTSFVPLPDHVGRALEIAVEIDHSIYDCLYLAVAEVLDAQFVTADERLLKVLAAGAYAGRARSLFEASP